jgi:class 3 adenylate cyclase
MWEQHPAHFWLVLLVALVNVGLGLAAGEAARRRADARLFLVSLAFLAAAGFLGLHALATPGVLLQGKNAGFILATPIGLLVASGFAAASAIELGPDAASAVLRHQRALRAAVFALLAAWAVLSLFGLAGLDNPLTPEEADGPLRVLAAAGVALYAFAAVRYLGLYRARGSPVPAAVAVAFVLLAEAMVAVAFGRNWHASWWEWHVLMAVAFGCVAWSAQREYRRQESVAGVFSGLMLDHTIERVDRRYGSLLSELVGGRTVDDLRERERLTADEAALLERAAAELRRLDDLFAPYLSPHLSARLRSEPDLARLGGEERDVTVLFADLQGFTGFSEQTAPDEVVRMLNGYWERIVPEVVAAGGLIERFAGDAVMVAWNAAEEQPDHALRASRAALALQAAERRVRDDHPEWPRFRVGVNTGPASVGNIGAQEQRSFAVIGDTTNLAARLQTLAEPGQVVIGPGTYAAIRDRADVEPLGAVELKGKREPVDAYLLRGIG